MWLIPILSAGTSILYTYISQKLNKKISGNIQNPQSQSMNGMMYIMMPAMSLYFGFILPAGLGLYWISNNILMVLQEFLLTKLLYKPAENQKLK